MSKKLSCLCNSLRYSDQIHLVDQAVGEDEIAVSRDVGVAHDVAAARNRPALEFLGLGIEAHHRVRRGLGFAVPDDIADRGDAIRSEEHTSELQSLTKLV